MELFPGDGLGWRLLRLKWLALDEGVNEFADGILLVFCGDQDFVGQVFIGETEGATETVFDQASVKPRAKSSLWLVAINSVVR